MKTLLRSCVPMVLSLALILVALVTLLGRTQAPSHAAGAGPTLALYHNFGPPYAAFLASGAGFGTNETVTITFDTKLIGTATTSFGKFSQNVSVPGSATPENHTVTATGQTSGLTASATFLVQTWWVMFGYGANNSRFNPYENVVNATNASQLTTRWAYGTDKTYPMTPIVRKDNAYLTTHKGQVVVVRVGGSVMWLKTVPTTISSIAPAVYYGIVYVGADDGNLYAFNYNTGALYWTLPTGGPILSSTVISGSTAYFGSGDSKLYAIDAETYTTPKVKWTYPTGGPISATPASDHGTVFAASQDGSVYAINSLGTLLWQYKTGGPLTSSPAVVNGLVYVGSSDHTLYALNESTGALAWSYTTNGPISSSPAIDKTNVYIGSQDNNLYALNVLTGSLQWSYTTGGAVNSSPGVANGVVYVGSEDNSLYAFDTKHGTKLWSYTTGGMIDSSPVISDGVVAVGSADGHLYSFHLPGTTP